MKRTKAIILLILGTLTVLSIISAFSYDFKIDVLRQWTFRIISFAAVGCIVWFFVKDVMLQKCPKKRYKK